MKSLAAITAGDFSLRSDLVVDLDDLFQAVSIAGSEFATLEFAHLLLEFLDFVGHGREGFRKRIVDLLGIGDHDSLAGAEDDVSRHADDGGVVRHISQHDRTGADTGILADGDVAQHARACANDHVVPDGRVTLADFLARATEGYPLVERYVVADDRSFTNDDAHAVIDEEAAADLGARMNLDAGDQPPDL